MRLWRIIAVATAVETSAAGALIGLAGLGGWRGGALDLLNNFAPFWLLLSLFGMTLTAAAMPRGGVKGVILALGGLGALAAAGQIAPETSRVLSPRPPAQGVVTRVVSFNTWSQNTDPAAALRVLRESGADVVVLIEMPPSIAHRLRRLADLYPYASSHRGVCASDLAILSRRPFSISGCQLKTSPATPGGVFDLIWGRTSGADGRPLTIATTHYTWPIRGRLIGMQQRALLSFIRRHASPDLIVAGDFNLTPWTFNLRAQDRAFRPLVRADRAVFTWPANLPKLGLRAPFPILPIDHIYAGPGWRATALRRLPIAGSDHYGIEAGLVRMR